MSLRAAILHCLSLAPDKGVPEFALKIEARLRLRRPLGETEWTMEVTTLVERGHIVRTTDALTDDPGLLLTTSGRAAINQTA